MIIQAVVSENKGQEGAWISALCVLILLLGAILLPYNSTGHQHQTIEPHQVLITSLTPPPLSMISELRLAHEEIRYFYQANQTWLSVNQLEQDWIAPFVKDKSWEHQGKHIWVQVADGVYQSEPTNDSARYILISQHEQLDIWIDLKQQAQPINLEDGFAFNTAFLIKAGWTQVVFESDNHHANHQH
ncbi:hypothetical protein E2R68_07760 [Psychromonas sp. RZ22]|uniref:DUF6162 family protein n=1 Tax=Psychromonas algarum TaxID=2555643 RepID=UPI001067446D|nr:hypothetical protein [Psychromonas sp. RZ22]TEW54589.1 hypothetical protein E2R68_07760 [Psychromonas sp. RZ22]